MLNYLFNWIALALEVLNQSNHRIIWNLSLALIPLIFSFWLFRPSTSRSVIWWTIFLIFVAFLPNAPYVLTDSIHLPELISRHYPLSIILLILIPQYILFIFIGFQAYVIALMRLDDYLISLHQERYLRLVNAIAHILCVVGIYLGRFERFNSWDLATQPLVVIQTTLHHLTGIWEILTMAIATCLLGGLFHLTEHLNQQIMARVR
ncbi:MAG: DUF1361 domain-containing protein [Pleurocapsa sp.]